MNTRFYQSEITR